MARLLQDGKLVDQDLVEACKWASLAARGGPFDTTSVMGRSRRDSLALTMSGEHLAEGQRRADIFVPHRPTEAEFAPPSFLRDLKLQGISVSADRLLAIINNQTFQAGDERSVKVAARTVSIRCLEIKEGSVFITVAGLDGTRELRLSGL